MLESQVPGAPHKFQVADSFITKLHLSISNGLPHFTPLSALNTHEHHLVTRIVQLLQGFPSSFFYWDADLQCFRAKQGIYVSHLSQTTLKRLFNPFLLAGSCLKRVEIFIAKVQCVGHRYPTLCAFANSVNSWLKRLRDGALKEEELLFNPHNEKTTTLLGLFNSLSSLCAGAEHLCQIIYEVVPGVIFDAGTTMINMLPCEVAVHILNHLFNKLSDVCLVQGGEGDPYQMLLFLFVGTLLPYLRSLDSWLYDGILDDPFEEMFFCGNSSVSIDQPSFWETSYLLRSKPRSSMSQGGSTFAETCPKFFATMSKAIMSAGKSLQLVHHAQDQSFDTSYVSKTVITCDSPDKMLKSARAMGVLTLAEVFLISLVGLTNDRDHMFEKLIKYSVDNHTIKMDKNEQNSKAWLNFLSNAIEGRSKNCSVRSDLDSFHAFNPAVTVCSGMLANNKSSWEELNISGSFYLPPLNDNMLRKAVFGSTHSDGISRTEGTDYRFGTLLGEIDLLHMEEEDKRALEGLCAFPTILPSFPEEKPLSEILPFQKDSTLSSRVLKFIQNMKFKESLDPAIMIQECLSVYIKRQVDHVGRSILRKLMGDWRLMDELFVLRSIYLLGSGDLLQQFLVVIFNRLDKGDSWDDDFELNTLLQDSIRNSADRTLLSAPDSLTVSVSNESTNTETRKQSTQENLGSHNLGIDSLDKLCFSYKVSWPLDLIANVEALRKYNQVMGFLLKVKRAKFLLDKTRTWRWKDRSITQNYKKHLLIEQKLLHFVDSFHHYVMDRVYHSAWTELCSGMEVAGSLDEVIEVHETYLSSIQRQCFIASDKLWALIASRVKTILGLALDFYNVKQSLRTGGTSAAIEARCEAEINRIEKQFDDCVAFLLRILSFKLNVGHFPHLADLVTRINYNYFYMSDSGNLLTVPRFESTGNFGKAPAFRPSAS